MRYILILLATVCALCAQQQRMMMHGIVRIVIPDVGVDAANDWANRVETNGGPRPATSSINAVAAFYNALSASNILSKMKVVNVAAPDGTNAARTPLIRGAGSDPWPLIGGSASPTISTNGILQSASSVGYYPGVHLNTLFSSDNDCGFTVYVSSAPTLGYIYGCVDGNPYPGVLMRTSGANFVFGCWFVDVTFTGSMTTPKYVGYYSMNRVSSTDVHVFFASSTNAHAVKAIDTTARLNRPSENFAFQNLTYTGSPQAVTDATVSFYALHTALSTNESSAFYTCIQNLRSAFGGGSY